VQHRYYPALDGLRAVAVSIVLVAHAGVPGLASGGVGVEIFFTLSGFLITSLLLAEHHATGSISFRRFYARRFLRLMPALWLVVGSVMAAALALGLFRRHFVLDAAYALAYITNWARIAWWTSVDSPLAHTWSLAAEEQYYVIWPIVVLVLARAVPQRRQRAVVLLMATGVAVTYRWVLIPVVSPARIYFGLDTHADGLLFGSALATFFDRRTTGVDLPLGVRIALVVAATAVLGGVIAVWTWHDPGMALIGFSACALATGVLIADVVSTQSVSSVVLSRPALVWIGRVSYGLYLWHFPLYYFLEKTGVVTGWREKLIVALPLTVAIATASYYLVEVRFLRLKGRFAPVLTREAARGDGLTTSASSGVPQQTA
jgi:peptidoglycan/LPS O-acetylase OafA/YrhL